MLLSELVTPEHIVLGWPSGDMPAHPDKWILIRELLSFVAEKNPAVKQNFNTTLNLLTQREKSMTTGIGDGIAIPHTTVPFLKEPVGSLCILPELVEFESLDRKGVRLIILILMPKDKFQEHIKTLANISKLLHVEKNRQKFFKSGQPEKLWSTIVKLEIGLES